MFCKLPTSVRKWYLRKQRAETAVDVGGGKPALLGSHSGSCSPAELDPFEQKDTTVGLCPSKRKSFLGCGMFSFPFLKGGFLEVLLGSQFFR